MVKALVFSLIFLLICFSITGIIYYSEDESLKNNENVIQEDFRSGETVQASEIYDINDHLTAYVKEIHGCEYIILYGKDSAAIVHHEACRNRSGHLNK